MKQILRSAEAIPLMELPSGDDLTLRRARMNGDDISAKICRMYAMFSSWSSPWESGLDVSKRELAAHELTERLREPGWTNIFHGGAVG